MSFFIMGTVNGKKFSIAADNFELGIYQKTNKKITMPVVITGKNFDAGTALIVAPKERAAENGILLTSKKTILFVAEKKKND